MKTYRKLLTMKTLPVSFARILAVAAPVVAGAVMLGAPAAAPQAQTAAPTQPVLPGYWEYTTSALGSRDTEQ